MRVGVAVVAVWWLSVAAGQKKDWGGVEDSLVLLLDARFYTCVGSLALSRAIAHQLREFLGPGLARIWLTIWF